MNLVKLKANNPVKRGIRKYQPTYYNPFKEMFDWVDNYSTLFDYGSRSEYYTAPRLNMKDEGDQYVIEVDVPGYAEEDLNISIDGDQMTITGNYSDVAEDQTDKYLVRERYYGKFVRTVNLPNEAYADGTEASLEKGLLSLYIPKNKDAKTPKTIEIVTKD